MHSKGAPRRRHSDELKARVLAACDEVGASVAAVALAYNLNANLVHKWRRGRGAKTGAALPTPTQAPPSSFVALSLPSAMVGGAAAPAPAPLLAPVPDIRVQLKRGATAVVVSWPTSAAADCAAWLRELLR
jgi:transposase